MKQFTLLLIASFSFSVLSQTNTCYEQLEQRKNKLTSSELKYSAATVGTTGIGVAALSPIMLGPAVIGFGIIGMISGGIYFGASNWDENKFSILIEQALLYSELKREKPLLVRTLKKLNKITGENVTLDEFSRLIVEKNATGELCKDFLNIQQMKKLARESELNLKTLAINQDDKIKFSHADLQFEFEPAGILKSVKQK